MTIAGLLVRTNRRKTPFEVEEELQFHIEMLERKYAQQGMSAADANAAAMRRFGNLERIKQHCVDIRERNSSFRRVLKASLVLIALTGLSIHILNSNFKIARIGHMLIIIAISARVLLYVRGLSASTFLHRAKQTSLSVVTDTPEDDSLREA
jgi:hypothetical protein